MKAAVYSRYGPPDVVTIREVPKPSPKTNELLVRIHATTVNRTDCGFRTAEYLLVRLVGGLIGPKKTILGSEFAGVVEAVGSDVKSFRAGAAVFGLTGTRFGAHAEYLCVPEEGAVAEMPTDMSHEEATAICDGPWLAMNILRSFQFKKVRRVLINGASGSIGTACVQLSKYFGAEVTAVCSARNIDVVRSLGADHVIDYEKDDFTKCGGGFDLVIDAVGMSSFHRCKPLLTGSGAYISTELGHWGANPVLALLTPILGGKQVRFPIPRLRKIRHRLVQGARGERDVESGD